MQKIKTLIIVSIIVFLGILLVINILGYRLNIANGVPGTGNEIKQIEMRMTLEQVISILGKPYEIDYSTRHHSLTCKNPRFELGISVNETTDIIHVVDSIYNDTNYCCDAYEETKIRFGKEVTLIYTNRSCLLKSLFVSYPMLWVHLDSSYCVNSVFAKLYPDDICIYSLSWKTDKTTLEEIPGEVDLFINEELFNKCFKK